MAKFHITPLLKTALGIAVFGLLMAFRNELLSMWSRVMVAALAGGIFAWLLFANRRPK